MNAAATPRSGAARLAARLRAGPLRAVVAPALLVLLCACSQETLSLGRYEPGGAREPALDAAPDFGSTPDGGAPIRRDAAARSPITLSLEVAGRTNVSRLSAACESTCLRATLRIEGGVPPYDVRWDDGERGVQRELCVDPLHTRSVAVSDSSDGRSGPASLGIPPVTYEGCGDVGSDHGWTVCQKREVATIDCPESSLGKGFGIDLGEGLETRTWLTGSFLVRASELYVPALDVFASATPCGEDYLAYAGGFVPLDGRDLTHGVLAIGEGQQLTAVRYLVWYAYDLIPPILPTLPYNRIPLELPADLEVLEAEVCDSVAVGAL